jgi:FkbM family methyltransferase
LEVGANDGISQSNTYWLEKRKGWNGILVDPNPVEFSQALILRSCLNKYVFSACGSVDKSQIVIHLAGLMSIVSSPLQDRMISSQIELVSSYYPNLPVWNISVPMNRIDTICLNNSICHVDFASIDVEGAEFDLLAGWDHDKIFIDLLLVESASAEKICSFLSSKNMTYLCSRGHDHIFSSPSFLSRNPRARKYALDWAKL